MGTFPEQELPEQELRPWLEASFDFQLDQRVPVGGGCIHRAWCLQGRWAGRREGRLFAKANAVSALPMFEAEAAGLEALARWAPEDLVVPRPLGCTRLGEHAVLVLPWLELGSAGPGWAALGEGLARLHRNSLGGDGGRGFGFEADNFIGASPQPNGWRPDWAAFFADCRLAPQLELAAAAGQVYRGAQALVAALPSVLGEHHCEPVLVHGDLWSGNAGLLASGAALFDPACAWADREVDLAMARLFGGFPAAFFQGYQQTWPLPAGAEDRLGLYNLYHLLNHANLFGGGYRQQAQRSIDTLTARWT